MPTIPNILLLQNATALETTLHRTWCYKTCHPSVLVFNKRVAVHNLKFRALKKCLVFWIRWPAAAASCHLHRWHLVTNIPVHWEVKAKSTCAGENSPFTAKWKD